MPRPKYYQKREKKSNADSLVKMVDDGPIAGVGDSLKELDEKLRSIDESTRLKCLKIALDEYKEFHDQGMK